MLQALRSVAAVIGAFFLMVLLVDILSLPTNIFIHSAADRSTLAYYGLQLVYSAIAAVVGGVVAAEFGRKAPVAHGFGVGLLAVAVGVFLSRHSSTPQPMVFSIVVGLVLMLGTVGGAIVVAKQRRKMAEDTA